MYKNNRCVLVVSLCATMFVAEAFGQSSYVSKKHPLFSAEREARTQQIENLQNYEHFGVKAEQDLAETYRQLIFLKRSRNKVAYKRSEDNILIKFDKSRAIQAESAHDSYPGSAAIASLFAYYKYSIGHSLRKPIAIIAPYIQQNVWVPGIPRTMLTIFDREAIDYKINSQINSSFQAKKYNSLFGLEGKDSPDIKEVLRCLKIYWATKINPSYSEHWSEEKVDKNREKLTPEKRRMALRAWRNLIAQSYRFVKPQVLRELSEEKIRQRRKEQRAQQDSNDRKRQEQLKQAKEDVKLTLESWEKSPNELIEIMKGISKLSHLKRLSDDWNEGQIPNYNAVKEKLGEEEAKTLNLFYMSSVLDKKQQTARELSELMDRRPKDTRLLMLKAHMLMDKDNLNQAKKVLDKVLEIDPQHYKARNTLWRLMEITQSEEE